MTKGLRRLLILFLCAVASGAWAAAPAGLLAEWRFDEGKGQVARDSSGNGRDATLSGASWAPLGDGFALSLDGEDDSASFGGAPPLGLTGPVSIEAWVKPTGATERLTMLLGQDLSSYLICVHGSDRLSWYVGRGANQVAARIRINEWNHVAATFDGKRLALWINGREAGRRESAVSGYPNRDGFVMGTANPKLPRFKGLLDAVRVYNRALSAEEVAADFTREASAYGLQTGPVEKQLASREESTRFFKSHPNGIDIVEKAGSLLFANRQIGLEFARSPTGFELVRLYGIAEERDFLAEAPAGEQRDLFQIRMALDPKFVARDDRGSTHEAKIGGVLDRMAELGKVFVIGSHAAKRVSWECRKGDGQAVLRLQWHGVDVKNEAAALNADVTVTLREGDPLSYWRFAVRNRGKRHGIERVRLPILNLAPVGEARRNVFIYPKWRGGYVEDPFNAPAGLGENYHTTGAYYPYYTNMQFWALYNRDKRQGVYLGTQDPRPHMTHYLVNNTPEDIAWSVSHFPANISFAGEDFALPYDCVVGPFQGDWYDAAQIYRAWALKQSWARKGPLSRRADVPKWYKEAPLFFYTIMNDSATGTYSVEKNLKIAADHFREWLTWAGVRLPLNFYTWHAYDPSRTMANIPFGRRQITIPGHRWEGFPLSYSPFGNYPAIPAMPGFADTVQRLRADGGMVTPYVCLQVYDQGATDNAPYASEARHHMMRDLYGAMQTYPGMRTWFPCVASRWWRERMVETCATLMEREHVAGFYLDVMHGIGMPCFWTPHGHSAGGGGAMTDAMHELVEAIHETVKARDADAIITGEDSTENMIDGIDGILYQRTLRPENKVPLFGTVYNDYIPRYGLELSVSRPKDFFIECASLFVEGAQIGRLRLRPRSDILQFENPAHKEMIAFLGRIVSYYKQDAAKKFLVYGRLLRPLEFSAPSAMPMLLYGDPEAHATTDIGAGLGKAAGLHYPALMSGVFRSDDGEYGIFVANASDKEIAFEADWTAANYEAADAAFHVDVVQTDGASRRAMAGVRGVVSLKETLAARGVVMFRLTPAAQ